MTSEKCKTHLYLTFNILGLTKKNMSLLELPTYDNYMLNTCNVYVII